MPHFNKACQKRSLNQQQFFTIAASWARKNGIEVPEQNREETDFEAFRKSLSNGWAPRIPAYVRGFIAHVLHLNNVEDYAPAVIPMQVAPSRTHRVRDRRPAYHRPRPAHAN
jgi:hypothetical protein